MTHAAIELINITKSFGAFSVIKDLTMQFAPGEPTFLLGQNGAGKSTLLRIIAGILTPDSGERKIPITTKSLIGYSAHEPSLYGPLTVLENLTFFAKLTRAPLVTVTEALETWNLLQIKNLKPAELSRGQLAKVGIARALLGDPDILLFDEPTAFLDTQSASTLVETISRRSHTQYTVIATHDIERIRSIASRTVLLTTPSSYIDSRGNSNEEIFSSYQRNNR